MRRLRSVSGRRSSSWCFHVDDRPLRIESVRQPLARAHQLLGLQVRPDRDQQAVAREPGPGAVIGRERSPRRRVDAIGRAAERNLAQRQQVALAEEAFGGDSGLLRVIDLAGLEPRKQIIRWQVDQLDFVGLVEYAIGDGLALPHAR